MGKIASQCQDAIRALSAQGYETQDMVADYTSGTKAMSAGLTIAAIKNRLGTLVYVSGERDNEGRVIPGTERPIPLSPNQITADLLFEDAVGLFNKYQFDASLETLEKAKNLLRASAFVDKVEFMEDLCRAYLRWDRFDLTGAFELLRRIKKEKFLSEFEIRSVVMDNLEILFREKENQFCYERMIDLLENARRRGDTEKKFDDAVARLYRLCEYIAQYHIFKKNRYEVKDKKVDTSSLIISGLDAPLKGKYSKYRDEKDGKVKLSLYASYELLSDLGEEVGKRFIKDEILSKKLLGLRNNSILAHGFDPICEKTYKDMLGSLEGMTRSFIENSEQLSGKVQFPVLNV